MNFIRIKYRLVFAILFFFMCIPIISMGQSATIDSLEKVLANGKEDTSKVNNLIRIGLEYMALGDFDKTISISEDALKLAKKINFQKGTGNAYRTKGKALQRKNDLPLAMESYSQALLIWEKIGDKPRTSVSLMDVGHMYKKQNDHAAALDCYNKALEVSRSVNDEIGMANALMSIGTVHYKRADYPEALDFYYKALKKYEDIGEITNTLRTLNNIAIIQEIQKDYKNALKTYAKTLRMAREINSNDDILNSLAYTAIAYYSQGKFDESLLYNDSALVLARKLNNKIFESDILNNIGNIYGSLKDYDKALTYFYQSLKIREELDFAYGIAESMHQISSMLLGQKKTGEALIYGLRSLELSEKLDAPEFYENVLLNLSEIYEKKGDGVKSLYYYKEYIKVRDKLFNEENTRKTVESNMNYEFEKKQEAAKIEQEKKDAIQALEKQRQETIRNFFIVGFSLVLILLLVIFRGYRNKLKANEIISKQKDEVEFQKHKVEEKNKEILDSINYAKRIQYTLLAHEEYLNANLPSNFVLFQPKDIVSGDFYWAAKHGDLFFLAVCDSTGHGVPGAFMSLLNIGFLSEAINEKDILKPNEVLNHVRDRLIENVSKENQKDGFDGVLLCIDQRSTKVSYAAAYNSPVLIRDNQFIDLKADKMPVGIGEKRESFNLYEIDVQSGDTLYLYTDGYADQFGGLKGKKFMYKRLNELILQNVSKPMQDQKEILRTTFNEWKGNLEQIDDVCVVGIEF